MTTQTELDEQLKQDIALLVQDYTEVFTHVELEPHPWTGQLREVRYVPTTICNNFEIEAILAHAEAKYSEEKEDSRCHAYIMSCMHDRQGQPSPRQKMTFDQLPRR